MCLCGWSYLISPCLIHWMIRKPSPIDHVPHSVVFPRPVHVSNASINGSKLLRALAAYRSPQTELVRRRQEASISRSAYGHNVIFNELRS